MLSSVLSGEVLRSEKTRIGGERPSSELLRNELGRNLWWGIRAKLRGRTSDEERTRVFQRRDRTVDLILEEVNAFKVVDTPTVTPAATLASAASASATTPTPAGHNPLSSPIAAAIELANSSGATLTAPPAARPSAFDQVRAILAKLAHAESLYPNRRAFRADKALYDSAEFQTRVDALVSWSNVVLSLRTQIGILQKWTGSEDLDVKRTDGEEPIRGIVPGAGAPAAAAATAAATSSSSGAEAGSKTPPTGAAGHVGGGGYGDDDKAGRPPTFVERVMKEDSLQRTFEKKTLSDLYALISSAKSTYLQHSEIFSTLNLPPYQTELTKLIAFPTQLMEESLKIRLAYALKVEDRELQIIALVVLFSSSDCPTFLV